MTLGAASCSGAQAPKGDSTACVEFSVRGGSPREAALAAMKASGIDPNGRTGLGQAVQDNINVLYVEHNGKYPKGNLPVGNDVLAICVKGEAVFMGPEDRIIPDNGDSKLPFLPPTRFDS